MAGLYLLTLLATVVAAGTHVLAACVLAPACDQLTQPPDARCCLVNFPGSTNWVYNPERGFYHHTETLSSAWAPLTSTQLRQYVSANYSLIFRNIVLDQFVNKNLTSTILQKITDDFITLRNAGMKVVLRFCYSLDASNINDAPPAQLAAHIQQLTPLLQTYAGVIAVLQAGFIGVWGEWYYTANYGNNGVVTSQDWYKRTQVVNQLLQALPASRQIQLRTPYYKQKILGRTSPITSSEAFTNTPVARIGQHNDCFLASDTDFGTYVNKAMEYPYLKNETLYLSMGGETCANNPPRSSCPTALQEMAELHYRFLNVDYIQVVLDAWRTQGCFNTIWSSMGYNLVGVQAQFPAEVAVGCQLKVGILIANKGWAAPINYRSAQLVLHHVSTKTEYVSALAGADLRRWLPGQQQKLQFSMTLPTNAPLGNYQVLLLLPDGDSQLRNRPEYNIVISNMIYSDSPGRRLNLVGSFNAVP
ncbi:uncharacterized protein [Procambarus clarkii]|uniref:uncharacterized protein n=1 Tax=Procambarus clarkii TaxID=6728 RepID=UPI003743D6FC